MKKDFFKKRYLTFSLLFVAGFFLFTGCNKDEGGQIENEDVYKFTKELTIKDNQGNVAFIEFSGNDKSFIESAKDTDFVIKTTTMNPKSLNLENNIISNNVEEDDEPFWDEDDEVVFINVKSHELIGGVTGFAVVPVVKANNSAASLRWDETKYNYGYNDVIGAFLSYDRETRPKEYLKVDLDKKTASSNVFWQNLAASNLYNEGSVFSYTGPIFDEFRLRWKNKKGSGNGYAVTWFFWVQ